jgi:hypothetical protein
VTQTPATTDHGQPDELSAAMVDRIAAQHEALGLLSELPIFDALS